MSWHLDEGALQALIDGELPPGERGPAEAHLSGCGECAAALRDLRAVNERAVALLARADAPAPVARAQMRMRARRLSAGRWREGRAALLRAAVLVACVAGVAAAAVPGSPVRAWIAHAVLPAKKETLRPANAPVAPPVAAIRAEDASRHAPTGVSIRPDGSAVRVVFTAASPQMRVTARLVDGGRAGVLARGPAAAGARFRTAPGRIEVVGAGAGEVEVQIPRSASTATVEVNGRVYLERSGDGLKVLAPAAGEGGGPEIRVGG